MPVCGVDPEYSFCYTLVGDCNVGKTALARNVIDEYFYPYHEYTCGVDYFPHIIDINPNPTEAVPKKIKLMIWDTAGQERFRSITPAYVRKGVAMIFMYDLTKRASFEHLSFWQPFVNEYITQRHKPTLILIGNKTDLAASRQITTEEGQAYAMSNGMLFYETSAKTGHNVAQAFKDITEIVYKRINIQDITLHPNYEGVTKYSKKVEPFIGRKKSDDCC